MFPAHWLKGRIAGKATSLDSNEIKRSIEMLNVAIAKYPQEFLKKNLKQIYVFSSLEFFGVGYGGTYHKDAVYICNKGLSKGYTAKFMEKVFHAELSSVLYSNFAAHFPKTEWRLANAQGFSYGNGGVNAIKRGRNGEGQTQVAQEKGFLTQYGMSDMENDINSYAKNIFGDKERFWKQVYSSERIRKKSELFIQFYHQMDHSFTEAYFKKL
ncbi:MAG: hypothetical protein JKY54_03915 [Flavobacteriales bacterium]|nr:hypothetical protein [Flavobacteriales bacterium]